MGTRGVALLLCLLPLWLGVTCDPELAERIRRETEGGATTPAAQDAIEARIAQLVDGMGGLQNATLAERMAFHGVPGVSIAVVRNRRVEWAETFGVREVALATPMDRTTRLQAASISKPTTALAVLRLVEAGVLSLDEPVNDSLVRWKIPDNAFTQGNPVTLRQVLTHTGGINVPSFLGYFPGAGTIPSLLEILRGENAINDPIEVIQPPGQAFRYSGGGFTVLAALIEDVTGTPYPEWMRDELLLPSRMWRSTFEQPLLEPEIANGLSMRVFGQPSRPWTYPEWSAAGLWTTALDLASLVVAIQESLDGEGTLLSQAMAREMLTPQVGIIGAQFGLGWFLQFRSQPRYFWHTGGNAGYESLVVGHAQGEGVGVAILTNASPSGILLATEIAHAVAAIDGWPDGVPLIF